MLDFQILLILTVVKLRGSHLHHHAKFHRNQSSGCGGIDFSIFQNGPAAILDF